MNGREQPFSGLAHIEAGVERAPHIQPLLDEACRQVKVGRLPLVGQHLDIDVLPACGAALKLQLRRIGRNTHDARQRQAERFGVLVRPQLRTRHTSLEVRQLRAPFRQGRTSGSQKSSGSATAPGH